LPPQVDSAYILFQSHAQPRQPKAQAEATLLVKSVPDKEVVSKDSSCCAFQECIQEISLLGKLILTKDCYATKPQKNPKIDEILIDDRPYNDSKNFEMHADQLSPNHFAYCV
jgi:hypothetical protein